MIAAARTAPTAPAAVPALSPLDETLAVMTALTEVLSAETGLVTEHRYQEAALLIERKAALADRYTALALTVLKNKAALAGLTVAQRQRLTEGRDALSRAVEANMQRLDRAEKTTARVVGLLVGAARRQQQPAAAYGRPGRAAPRMAEPLTLGFNRSL